MRRRTRWIVAGAGAATAAAAVAQCRSGTALSRSCSRGLTHLRSRLRYTEGRIEGAVYRLRGREPDPTVTDLTLADRIRSSLGETERKLDLPHVHVMVEHHVALLHGAVGTTHDAQEIEQAVAAVPGVAGVESYLHVGLGPWDTRPSAGRRVHRPSAAMEALLGAAEKAGVSPTAAPLVVRGVLATFADRLPPAQRAHLASNLPADVRPLFTPPRRIHGARPARSLRDLVGRVLVTTSDMPLDRAEEVTVRVVRALRDLVPGDVREISAVLPHELRELWESPVAP
jgi:uncharacterized protein (DUF2267 family)